MSLIKKYNCIFRKKLNGFSLMEFIVVIILISIISKISYPIYRDYLTKAKLSELLFKIQHSKFIVEQHYLEHYDLPNIDYNDHICSAVSYKYLTNCYWDGNNLELELDSSFGSYNLHPKILIQANINDYLTWDCNANNFTNQNIENFICG